MASCEENAFDDGLQSESLTDVRTPSPSILNSPKEQMDESDGEDDGVNVTIRPLRPPLHTAEDEINRDTESKSKVGGDAGKVKRRTLCGAARRRLQKLMNNGMDYNAAREQAKLPLASTPKRVRNSDLDRTNSSEGKPASKKLCDGQISEEEHANDMLTESPSQQVNEKVVNNSKAPRNVGKNERDPKDPKLPHISRTMHGQGREALPAPTYSDIANRVRLGIMPKNYPVIELSTNQQEVVQEALLLKVVQQRREQFKPKFACCRFRPGYLVLTCQGKETANWVKDKFTSLVLWEGADLVVVDEDKIPRPEVLIAFFPWSAKYSNDMILSLIESQTEDMFADTWRVLYRRVKGEHLELSFTVDDSSLRKLSANKFVLHYRYGQIQITKKRPAQPIDKRIVPVIPTVAPDEKAMDCELVLEGHNIPGTSRAENYSFVHSGSSGKDVDTAGAIGLDSQGQQNALGYKNLRADDLGSQGQNKAHDANKSKARKPSGATTESSIQNRLQQRD
ncbi:uncharacterized protein LOC134284923 [Aedes albopictus]|uniref:DUF4780 domain-containing protein n=1 Tax=Aedes albopictus TaxID=7160 RepID=A0ABM1YNE4_AEDAL